MALRIIWSEPAVQDIEQAAEYIGSDSREFARSLVAEAMAAVESLRRFPRRGHIVPEFESPNIREIFVRRFRLIYEFRGDAVYLLGFIHGARELAGVFDRSGARIDS